jgi:hypothetical protein
MHLGPLQYLELEYKRLEAHVLQCVKCGIPSPHQRPVGVAVVEVYAPNVGHAILSQAALNGGLEVLQMEIKGISAVYYWQYFKVN